MTAPDLSLAGEAFCYLTTTGRTSGEPREIEIWFALDGGRVYLMAGGREKAHWVRNIQAKPEVTVRIAGQTFVGRGRVLDGGDADDVRARELLLAKYGPAYGGDLSGWGRSALPVAIEF